MGLTVVGKEAATVMISSPGLNLFSSRRGEGKAVTASKFVDDPELVKTACDTPTRWASFLSNTSAKRPVVSQKSNTASLNWIISFSSNTRPETGTAVTPGMKGWEECLN